MLLDEYKDIPYDVI